MGFKIFAHAIGLVFHNLGQALRISGVLYLLTAGSGILVTMGIPSDPSPAHIALAVVVTFLEAVAAIWIAVAWHRYVLLDEATDSILPQFNGRRILVYFGYSLLLGLVAFAAVFVISFVVVFLQSLNALILAIPLGIAGALAFFVGSYRLGIVLPASSVEKSIGIGQAWQATKGSTGALLALGLLSTLALIVLQALALPLTLLHLTFAVQIWNALVGWVALMVGVAILTTLYGYYVEHRAIP